MQELFAAGVAAGWDLRVLYMESAAPDTYWGDRPLADYEEILPGRWFWFLGGRVHFNPTVTRRLKAIDADVYVVAGYFGLTQQLVMRWLSWTGRRWVMHAEASGMRKRGRVGRMLRAMARRPAVRRPHGIAAVGERAANDYAELASDRVAVRNIPYFTDLSAFESAASAREDSGRRKSDDHRASTCEFVYCGQLIKRKGVDVLIEAFNQLVLLLAQRSRGDGETSSVRLRMLGTGPMADALRQRQSREAREATEWVGFCDPRDLAGHFADGDVFVLPSRHDGWGVVVNQALGAGLPVIATSAVGASEWIDDGRTGRIVGAGSVEELADAMHRVAIDKDWRERARRAIAANAKRFRIETGVQRWTELFERVSE